MFHKNIYLLKIKIILIVLQVLIKQKFVSNIILFEQKYEGTINTF